MLKTYIPGFGRRYVAVTDGVKCEHAHRKPRSAKKCERVNFNRYTIKNHQFPESGGVFVICGDGSMDDLTETETRLCFTQKELDFMKQRRLLAD